MEFSKIPNDIKNKVLKIARENFEKYNNEFGNLDHEDLFKAAYLHGFNCAHNIYDVAEERDRAYRKRGPTPTKDIPDISLNVLDGAEKYLNFNNIEDEEYENIYIAGYREGFSSAMDEFSDKPLHGEVHDVIDYYLSGNKKRS